MKNNSSPKMLNTIVTFGIIITCILLLGTPLIMTAFFKSQFFLQDQGLVTVVSVCIYLCAAPYVIALFKLRKLSGLVVKNNPFSRESVRSLKTIAICAFSEIFIFAACLSFLKYSVEFFKYIVPGGPIIVVTFICALIGFLCLALSQLFETAIEIKEENDWTI